MRKIVYQFAIIFAFTAFSMTPVEGIEAQDEAAFKIIVNKANPTSSITRSEVANLFLKKKTKWSHGVTAAPVDQKTSALVRKKFSKEILKKSVSAVNAFWQQRIFSGQGIPPLKKSTDAGVIAFVASKPGGIGYISASSVTNRVKELKIH